MVPAVHLVQHPGYHAPPMRNPDPSDASGPEQSRMTDAAGMRVAVVIARYHRNITERLLEGARRAYAERGGDPAHIRVIDASGAFELPVLCHAAARCSDIRAVVALGCIIRGETPHDLVIARSVADAMQRVAIDTGKAAALGVLTCLTHHQAEDRAGGRHGNKGEEAMHAALDTAVALDTIARTDIRTVERH